MEALNVLESKVAGLLTLIANLKAELASVQTDYTRLNEENMRLKEHLEALEHSLLKNHQNLEELQQEKSLTEGLVGDLINNIDSFVKKDETLV